MTTSKNAGNKRIPGWIKTVFIILLLGGMALVVWQQLPRGGISTDLTVIGTDRPTLVLTRDTNFVGGGEVLDFLRAAQAAGLGFTGYRRPPAAAILCRCRGVVETSRITARGRSGVYSRRISRPCKRAHGVHLP